MCEGPEIWWIYITPLQMILKSNSEVCCPAYSILALLMNDSRHILPWGSIAAQSVVSHLML